MAEVQTTYSDSIAKGYAGMVANGETSNRITRTCEPSGGMAFGVPAFLGSDDHGCTNTVGTAAQLLGFVIATQGQAVLAGQTADEYQQYDNVPILTQGAIYVNVVGAVTPGAALSIGITTDAADGIGASAADSTHIALTGWVADESATDGLCRIVRR